MRSTKLVKFTMIVALLIISSNLPAQLSGAIWDYPIKPGSESWASFASSQEMIDACQIPEDILAEFKNCFLDMCIDVILAQTVFLEKLDKNQEKQLMNVALKRLSLREQLGNSYYRQKTTVVILSRILIRNNIFLDGLDITEQNEFIELNNYFILPDVILIEKIKRQSESYLKG